MDIGIIGAGSIGLLLAAYLGKANQVHLYVRREQQRNQLKEEGVYCDRFHESTPVHAHLINESIHDHDLLIVAVKQKDLDQVLKENLPSRTPLLFLQNGMGHIEKIAASPITAWVGVVEHGALKIGERHVKHTGRGKIEIAGLHPDESIEKTIRKLHHLCFPIYYHPDYYDMLSAKLVVNAVINPLTALFQQRNGAIATNPYIQGIAKRLCKEACTVLNRPFDQEWDRVLQVARNTAENQSSMFKDLLENRQTEIDAITGFILQKANETLADHRFILEAIHALEMEKGVRSSG